MPHIKQKQKRQKSIDGMKCIGCGADGLCKLWVLDHLAEKKRLEAKPKPKKFKLNLEVPEDMNIKKKAVFTITHEYSVEFHRYVRDILFNDLECTKDGKVVGKCVIINTRHGKDGSKLWLKVVSVQNPASGKTI